MIRLEFRPLLIAVLCCAFLFAGAQSEELFLSQTSSVEDNSFFKKALENRGNPDHFQKIEIMYLLEAVRKSPLTFIRNGQPHSGADAAKHLMWKYQHVSDQIKKSRVFVDKIASESFISRRPYIVKFPDGRTAPVRELMYNELERLERAVSA